MANEEHLKILKQGVEVWNEWREENPEIVPNLSAANLFRANLFRSDLNHTDLRNANLINATLFKAKLKGAILVGSTLRGAQLGHAILNEADLTEANLSDTDLSNATLRDANLSGAKLVYAILIDTDLRRANLKRADLSDANLKGVCLFKADLSDANLNRADLSYAQLVGTSLKRTNFLGCRVFGISAWELKLDGANQTNLIITQKGEPNITVDNLEVAQFIYLLLHNERIRHVIDSITSKVVLILGRFTEKRKDVLEAIRDELRNHDYLPVLFDFNRPASRNLTETISTLAHMARFIIADITDPKSIPQELQAIVPNLPSVPIQPLLLGSSTEYGMFEHFRRYPWVLEICRYHDPDELIQSIQTKVIAPAEEKAKALMEGKNR